MQRSPVFFIGHGSPMNAMEDNAFTREWQRIGASLPRPTSARPGASSDASPISTQTPQRMHLPDSKTTSPNCAAGATSGRSANRNASCPAPYSSA